MIHIQATYIMKKWILDAIASLAWSEWLKWLNFNKLLDWLIWLVHKEKMTFI